MIISLTTTGLNATCDSFYSSQGRRDENFRDCNSDLLSTISSTYPETVSLEMETFMLFHLAKSSTSAPLKDSDSDAVRDKDHGSIKAASAVMVFADRNNNEFISPKRLNFLRDPAGKAMLEALIEIELIKVHPDNEECVWNMKM
jgi:uridine phosphorylase